MIWKLATFAVIGALAYFIFRRSTAKPASGSGTKRAASGRSQPPRRRAEDMIECPRCGAYRRADAICECEQAPTP